MLARFLSSFGDLLTIFPACLNAQGISIIEYQHVQLVRSLASSTAQRMIRWLVC
jgi:hypothetical protein